MPPLAVPTRPLDRRTLTKGAGWAVPAIAIAAAAPSMAASPAACPTCIRTGPSGSSNNFTIASTGSPTTSNATFNLGLRWGTCGTTFPAASIDFTITAAQVSFSDNIASPSKPFTLNYTLPSQTHSLTSANSALGSTLTWGWTNGSLNANQSVPWHASQTANPNILVTGLCFTGTYSYVVSSVTHGGSIQICPQMCGQSTSYTSNLSTGSFQWNFTGCTANATNTPTVTCF